MSKSKSRKNTTARDESKREPTNTCPACETHYEERGPERLYECIECGKVGLDCCVPGSNAICIDCETDRG